MQNLKPTPITQGMVIPARVLAEDDETMTLQVAKDDRYSWKLDENDTSKNNFHTILFVKFAHGQMAVWRPWEGE